MGNSPDRSSSHPSKMGEQPDQRSSGEQSAHREQVQQEADTNKQSGPGGRSHNQNRKSGRDQDDGGQSGITGRDQNSR